MDRHTEGADRVEHAHAFYADVGMGKLGERSGFLRVAIVGGRAIEAPRALLVFRRAMLGPEQSRRGEIAHEAARRERAAGKSKDVEFEVGLIVARDEAVSGTHVVIETVSAHPSESAIAHRKPGAHAVVVINALVLIIDVLIRVVATLNLRFGIDQVANADD